MAACSDEFADDNVISFKLGDIFQSNNVKFDEIKENELPDAVLADLIDGEDAIQSNPSGHLQVTDNNSTEPARFQNLNDGEIDELALNTCKKKTHKQTIWGVKVLRG